MTAHGYDWTAVMTDRTDEGEEMIRTVEAIDEEVRGRITAARKDRGSSQQGLSELMNDLFDAHWDGWTVAEFEDGNRVLSAGEFVALLAILDVKLWTKP